MSAARNLLATKAMDAIYALRDHVPEPEAAELWKMTKRIGIMVSSLNQKDEGDDTHPVVPTRSPGEQEAAPPGGHEGS